MFQAKQSHSPFNIYQEQELRNIQQTSSKVLDIHDLPNLVLHQSESSFEWNGCKYYLELKFLQAYRGVLVIALRKLEERLGTNNASPLAIKVTHDLASRMLPHDQSLPQPMHSIYTAYSEQVVKEMHNILQQDLTQQTSSPALVSPHKPQSSTMERIVITNPTEVVIQQPFILYRGCQYRLRYDLPSELKAIQTNTIDAMIRFNSHLNECDPPAVIKVAGFIAAQVSPESFVRSSNQYIAYRMEVVDMLPSLVNIPVDKGKLRRDSRELSNISNERSNLIDFDEVQDHQQIAKKVRVDSFGVHDKPLHHSTFKDTAYHMESLSIAELLDVIGHAQMLLKSRLGCH